MTKFEFYLKAGDADGLFTLKDAEGREELSGNEYVVEIVENYIRTHYLKIKRRAVVTSEACFSDRARI